MNGGEYFLQIAIRLRARYGVGRHGVFEFIKTCLDVQWFSLRNGLLSFSTVNCELLTSELCNVYFSKCV